MILPPVLTIFNGRSWVSAHFEKLHPTEIAKFANCEFSPLCCLSRTAVRESSSSTNHNNTKCISIKGA